MSRVSIIIPTLNESASLGQTLCHLQVLSPAPWEVIVVDGGSRDDTVEIAKAAGVTVVFSEQRGRAVQMNDGAKVASGETLCFLHADTIVPDDLVKVIANTLSDRTVACGGFVSVMAGPQTTRWGVVLHHFLKTYYAPLLFRPHLFFRGLRILFGDQVIFCRRADFWQCGGFDGTLPIMEDADLCRRLFKSGRICQVNRIVQTSDRRVAKWGALKAHAIYLSIGFLWGVGVSATYLKQFYEDIR
ncbi:MAG: TIGR04283 family arsenosugar biosynthesis glycosyltransferase [Cyanophyceae cyanobacterium]